MTKTLWLAIPAGALTALGLEAVGILAGHVGMTAWRRGDNRTAVIAAVIMAVYVGIGSWELRGSVGMVVFWIAPLVYILVALQELLHRDGQNDEVRLAFELEQAALDNAAKRQLAYDAKMAKVTAEPARITRQDSGNLPADWRQLTAAQKARLAAMSRGERDNTLVHLAERTRREWNKRLDKMAVAK